MWLAAAVLPALTQDSAAELELPPNLQFVEAWGPSRQTAEVAFGGGRWPPGVTLHEIGWRRPIAVLENRPIPSFFT